MDSYRFERTGMLERPLTDLCCVHERSNPNTTRLACHGRYPLAARL